MVPRLTFNLVSHITTSTSRKSIAIPPYPLFACSNHKSNSWRFTSRNRQSYSMAVSLPSLPDVEQISTNIWRVLGGNPSKFTLQGTNTYLLGSGKERILVDTAQGFDAWRESLYSALSTSGQNVKVKLCVLTHWHHDHVMGVPDVRKHSPDVKIYKHLGNSYDPDKTLTKEQVLDIRDGQKFDVGSDDADDTFQVEALYAPGHAKDHMCLLITKSSDPDEIGCIFTADNVLGHGTAVFEDLALYIDSLKLMKTRAGHERRAFPGHGAVIMDAQAKLDEYIHHRQMREEEALNVLLYGTTTVPEKDATDAGQVKEWDSMDMVKIIYRMYPENLWEPAQGGLLQVLDKLKGDRKVIKTSGGKWKAADSVSQQGPVGTSKESGKSSNKL